MISRLCGLVRQSWQERVDAGHASRDDIAGGADFGNCGGTIHPWIMCGADLRRK